MKTVSVWNHKSSINGFESVEVIKRKRIKDNDEIIIVTDEYDFVEEIQFADMLKKNYNMPKETSIEDVVIEYQKIINNTDNNASDNSYLIKLEDKISILEQENADLLLDSASKDIKIQTIEKDLADLTLEVVMGGI